MLVAEFEVFLSRPVAPTRRVALGTSTLPLSPAPGFGAILLGAVVASRVNEVDPECHLELLRLTRQLEAGERIPQPRLRHRFQSDRVGLSSHKHRLFARDDGLSFALDDRGHAAPHILGALYAAGRVDPQHRAATFSVIRRALIWHGAVGPKLVAHLTGDRTVADWSTIGGMDPRQWALSTFGLEGDPVAAVDVQRRFRELVRQAHPDHGGKADEAASRIDALAKARHILLAG